MDLGTGIAAAVKESGGNARAIGAGPHGRPLPSPGPPAECAWQMGALPLSGAGNGVGAVSGCAALRQRGGNRFSQIAEFGQRCRIV